MIFKDYYKKIGLEINKVNIKVIKIEFLYEDKK